MWGIMTQSDLFPADAAWAVGMGDNEGLPIILRCNQSAAALLGHPEFTHRVGIAIPFNEPTENGLPSAEETSQLDAIEDFLSSHLEADQQAILVLVVTTSNMREFVFYAKGSGELIESALSEVFPQISSHEIQYYIEADPEWDLYQEFAQNSN
jgi:hypothetical protein